ncbi:MAG TPA: hypothetical protein VFV79_06190, partial [Saprospiraceae bacterium]|nr:hypothetical protein [Saprospiraceae bacterium]
MEIYYPGAKISFIPEITFHSASRIQELYLYSIIQFQLMMGYKTSLLWILLCVGVNQLDAQ